MEGKGLNDVLAGLLTANLEATQQTMAAVARLEQKFDGLQCASHTKTIEEVKQDISDIKAENKMVNKVAAIASAVISSSVGAVVGLFHITKG